jgi:hypothetical protein
MTPQPYTVETLRAEAARHDQLAADARQAAQRLEFLLHRREVRAARAHRPVEPRVTVGGSAVVIFQRSGEGIDYTYAAVGWRRRGDRSTQWSLTGTRTTPLSWADLLDFAGALNWVTMAQVTDARSLVDAGVTASIDPEGDSA